MSYIDIIFLSFGMGLLGSVHCMGMCGPLVVGVFKNHTSLNPWNYFTYLFGKTLAYAIIGFGFGLVGKSLHLFLSQQRLSLITGIFLLAYYMIFQMKLIKFREMNIPNRIYSGVKKITIELPLPRYYIMGFLNGFLPCGLVYLAAAASISTGHISKSILWMVFFGIGTIPSLSFAVFISRFLEKKYSFALHQIYRHLSLILAILLILRGSNLGIPYLSPKMNEEKQEVKCCYK